MNLLKFKLIKELYYLNLYNVRHCSKEENAKYRELDDDELPLHIDKYDNESHKFIEYIPHDKEMDKEELKLYLLAHMTNDIKTIKNIALFFFIAAVFALLAFLYFLLIHIH